MSWSDTDIPLKFESHEELQRKIDAYFDSCFAPVMHWIPNPEYDLDGDEIKNEGISKNIYVQKTDKNGDFIFENIRPLTISGLAVALDTSRAVLLRYQKEENTSLDPEIAEQCSRAIKRAKNKIEIFAEEYMFTGKNQTSAIFVAKNNFNWVDERKTDLTSKGDKIAGNVISFATQDGQAN